MRSAYAESLGAGAYSVGVAYSVQQAAQRVAIGGRIVAITDVGGGVFRGDGLDVDRLTWHLRETGSIAGVSGTEGVEARMRRVLTCAFDEVWRVAAERGISSRLAAYVIAVERVAQATRTRGLYP